MAKDRQRASGEKYGRGKVQEHVPEPIEKQQSRDAVGKAFGISRKTVDHIARIRKHGEPEVMQASMCAARAREIYEREAKERQQLRKGDQPGASPENLPDLKKGDARDIAGKAFGVSGKSVDHAKRVLDKGIPELAKAVDEGRLIDQNGGGPSAKPAAIA